jgi:hypothetical protein
MGHARAHHQGSIGALMVHTIDEWATRFLWVAQLVIVACLALVAWYAADRAPPFSVLSVTPAQARPGEILVLEAQVHREPWRKCSADFTRYVFDALDTRTYVDDGRASASMIESMEKRNPGILRVAFKVPDQAAPGVARLETVLHYRCNRVHAIWPIEVTTQMQFTVLP